MEGREPAGAGLDGRQLRTRLRDFETALARQQAEVTGLTAELDATNRGLIALHAELEAARGPLGLPIERDLHFQPTRIGDLRLREHI
jgi:hypothetical protein